MTDLPVQRLVLLEVEATINPATLNYLQTEILRAEQEKDSLVVVRLNTPGGLVSTTKDIIALIGRSSRPVVVWVTPEGASATSAGAIIASAAHGLYMNRGTNIGAATPVELGKDIAEKDGRSKAVNDLSALVQSLSETRGRNGEAFRAMIDKANSYTADEALKKGAIDGIATGVEDLRAQLQGKLVAVQGEKHLIKFAAAVEVVERPMDAGQRLLNVFAHPATAYILFVLGAALLYFEFQAPGGYVLGSLGVLCLLVAGIAFQVLPLNYGAAALLVAGVAFLVLEIYVTSYGLLAGAGIACLAAGSLFLYRHEDSWLTIPYPAIFSTLVGVLAFAGVVVWYLARHPAGKRVFFNLASHEGKVTRLLGQSDGAWLYQVQIGGEIWKARSTDAFALGDTVIAQRQDPDTLTLHVTRPTV